MAKWYYYDGVRKVGPISSEDLKVLADMSHIGVGTIVEAEDGRQTMARNIKGLFTNPTQSMFEEIQREPLVAESPAPPIQTPQSTQTPQPPLPPLPPRVPSMEPTPGPGSSTFGFQPEKPKTETAPKLQNKVHRRKPLVDSELYPVLQTSFLKILVTWWNLGVGILATIGVLVAIEVLYRGIIGFIQILEYDAGEAFEFLLIALPIFVAGFLFWVFGILILYLIGQGVRVLLKYDCCLNVKIQKEENK